MRLRPRPSPPSPGPADRVRDLLAVGLGGWVPPPEPGGSPHGPGYGWSAGGGAPPERGGDAVPQRAAAPPSSPEPEPDADDDARGPGSDDDPRGSGSDSSWQRPLLEPPAAHRSDGQRSSGPPRPRLDPGWRGAVALVAVALLAVLLTGAVVLRGRPQEVAAPDVVRAGVALPGASPTATAAPEQGEVVVAVAGKVARPGLVRLPAGSRVDDAVRAAGGALPGADASLLNLARRLVDGEQVLVGVDPPPGAPPGPPGAPGSATGAGRLLDLNTATAADLDALPGIGPVLAQRIVDWRTEHGRFASVEQLREVTGIGESKYADLEDSVTV